MLPGATGAFISEEFNCNKNNPVSSMKHLPSTVSHLLQHSTLCSTNITVISEHPSEVRYGKNLPRLSASTSESGIKSNSSSTDNTRNMLQNKHQNNDSRNLNNGTGAEAEDFSRRAETDLHGSSQFLPKISSNSTTVINITENPTTSHNTIQASTIDCSVEPDILNGYVSHMTDHLKEQNKSSHKKSVFLTYSQYSPVISSECDAEHLKDSINPTQSNVAHSTLTTNGENSQGNMVIELKEQRSWSENISAQHLSCNEFSVTTVKSPEYSISATLKEPIQNKDENSLVHNLVHSTNSACSAPHTEAEYSPQCTAITIGNIQNQESYYMIPP
jgi:hypothetical protein